MLGALVGHWLNVEHIKTWFCQQLVRGQGSFRKGFRRNICPHAFLSVIIMFAEHHLFSFVRLAVKIMRYIMQHTH
jgi:hypothetical protein